MAFIDDIRELAEKELSPEGLEALKTNEAQTKHSLIEPFIGILGYDRNEVMVEHIADIGDNKGKKVDYAIFKDGDPAILIECKAAGVDFNRKHINQLRGYFQNVKEARFGVLTNGLVYQFYTDLDDKNLMDSKPFLRFDLLDIQEPLVEELEKFTKAKFDITKIRDTASKLKSTQRIKRILTAEYKSPTKDFVNLLLNYVYDDDGSKVYAGRKTPRIVEEFKPIIKDAFQQFVDAQIRERQAHGDKNEVALTFTTDSGQSDSTQTDDKGWKPLSELKPQKGDSAPTEILFPGGDTKSIKVAWSAVLVEVARWLIDNNILNESHCPLRFGRSRYLVSSSRDSQYENFTIPEKIESFYIEKHHRHIPRTFDAVIHIIESVHKDPAEFKVR